MSDSYIRHRPIGEINPVSVEFMLPLSGMYLGVDVMRELSTTVITGKPELVKFFLERYREFFATASSEIRKQFPIDDPTIKSLKVLDPQVSHIEFPSLAPIASRFPNIVPNCNLQQLDNEWRLLGCSVIPLDGTLSIDQYWGHLSHVKNGSGQLTFQDS